MDTFLANHLLMLCALLLLGGAVVLACVRVNEPAPRRGGSLHRASLPFLEDLGAGYADPDEGGFARSVSPRVDLQPHCGCGVRMVAIDWDPTSGRANEWECPPCVKAESPMRVEDACAATVRCDMEATMDPPRTVRSAGVAVALARLGEGVDA